MAVYNLGQAAIVSKGAYSASTTYAVLNTVTHNGGSYMCVAPCTGVEPGVTSGWGSYWVATACGIQDWTISVSGTTATVNVVFSDGTTYSTTFSTAAVGENAVGTANLVNKSVTTAKIADGAVGAAQLASDLTYAAVNLTADQVIPMYTVTSVSDVGSSGDGIYLVKSTE